MVLLHMRRSAIFLDRPDGLIVEITWKVGKSKVTLSDERQNTLDILLCFCEKRKDFVPFQIGFHSHSKKNEKYLPI